MPERQIHATVTVTFAWDVRCGSDAELAAMIRILREHPPISELTAGGKSVMLVNATAQSMEIAEPKRKAKR